MNALLDVQHVKYESQKRHSSKATVLTQRHTNQTDYSNWTTRAISNQKVSPRIRIYP